ncbi:hypothetical protein DSO57_1029019 [Entomophthora muscae]|uniref:Uncharacterized protein n=1 Tax=Entomophthora muscae TaxID=34485 RepID=A0ACC2UM42_9FUNG|nr:hypothetical protein DSO57_1029019 [Entomophthora muscae]
MKEQEPKTKVQESKTKYKESKIFLENSKYWQAHIVSLTPWDIYQKVSKGIFLLRIHFLLLGNDHPFKLIPGYDPGHTLETGGQEPHKYLPYIHPSLSLLLVLQAHKKTGHEDIAKTYDWLQNNYFWENLSLLIPDVIVSCHYFQLQ